MKLAVLIKKEFYRFFRDPRLILTLLLPGLVIFLLYTVLGETMGEREAPRYAYRVYMEGSPQTAELIGDAAEAGGSTVEWIEAADEDAAREAVKQGEASAFLIFSEDFGDGGTVTVVYDALSEESSAFYTLAVSVLEAYGMRFGILPENLAEAREIGRQVSQGILPMLIVCFIFSAAMSVTLESVAGEKERGTLATVLVTSVRRRDVALGKVIPLSAISMLGAFSSFLGVALSLPRMVGLPGIFGGYGALSYILLLALILSIVPLVTSLIAVLSAFSRSVKEASAYAGVCMVLTVVLAVVASFLPAIGNWAFAVPVLGTVVAMQGILGGGAFVWQSLVSVAANLALSALFVFALAKMLSSERIMFGK